MNSPKIEKPTNIYVQCSRLYLWNIIQIRFTSDTNLEYVIQYRFLRVKQAAWHICCLFPVNFLKWDTNIRKTHWLVGESVNFWEHKKQFYYQNGCFLLNFNYSMTLDFVRNVYLLRDEKELRNIIIIHKLLLKFKEVSEEWMITSFFYTSNENKMRTRRMCVFLLESWLDFCFMPPLIPLHLRKTKSSIVQNSRHIEWMN